MISNYEIKNVDGKDILFLFFDFDVEFNSFKSSIKSLKNYIKDFIKDNKIAFTGTTVTLVVGGLIVGNVLLSTNDYDEIRLNSPYIASVVTQNNVVLDSSSDIILDDSLQISDEIEVVSNNIKKDQVVEKKELNSEKTYEKEITYVEESKKDENHNPKKDDDIYLDVYRTNGSILNIEFEEYIIGVVAAEMPAAFNIEALKSQAVVARTYALKSLSNGRKLTDNASTQTYKDNSQLKQMWGSDYNFYYNKIKDAVSSTKGIYLVYNGEIIDAVYHSTSNGYTEDAGYVWGNSYPYLISVESIYDNLNPSFNSNKTYSYDELSSMLGININYDTDFLVTKKTVSNRVETIKVDEKVFSGVQFRNILGLRSTDFEIEKNSEGVSFSTKGYGHGVGMSQYGANGYAKNGYSYEMILKHYYSGVSINHL